MIQKIVDSKNVGDSNNYLRWDGSDFTIKGDLTVDNIMTPSTIGGSSSTILNASASITAQGFALFKSASIGGFNVSDSQINDDNSNLVLKSSGQITASAAKIVGKITATSGQIAGWAITGDTLVSTNEDSVTLDGDNEKITIGGSTNYGTDGIQLEYNSGNPRFYVGDGSNKYVKYDGTDVDIKSANFVLDTTNLDISSAAKRITINDGTTDRIWMGEVDGGTTYGLKIFDGTGTSDSDIIVELGEGGNQIASWLMAPASMSSAAGDFRGIKMIPEDKVVGYGPSAHTKQTLSGSFSFGTLPTPAGHMGNLAW